MWGQPPSAVQPRSGERTQPTAQAVGRLWVQTGDMVDSLVRSPKAATTEHALESERSRGETEAVCGTVAVGELDDDGTVCPARDLAPGGIQHPGALPAGGLGGSGGRQSCTAPSYQPDAARDRAADCRIAAPAHALGTAQAEGGAGGPAAG